MNTTTLQQLGILTVADRCDRCPAQAYVRATVAGLDLLFCSHHAADHLPALVIAGAQILDERWVLQQ